MSDKTFSREQLAEATRKALEAEKARHQEELLALKEKAEKLEKELTPLKEKQWERKVVKTVNGLTDENKLKDAIALAGVNKDDDDEIIKSKVQKVIESRPWLQPTVNDPATEKQLKKVESVKPKEEIVDEADTTDFKFVKL